MEKVGKKLTAVQVLCIGYLVIILIGTFLLCLPAASRAGVWTNFVDSLFTSASATCVTGLAVFDTFTYWSGFGQAVILLLIQIGGIGFMTVFTLFGIILRRHIGIYERSVLMETSGAPKIGGLVQLMKRILIGTAIFELLGAGLLAIRFIPAFGAGRGIYFAVFHSISAFCNAGFDLMGVLNSGASFIPFSGDVLVNLTLMFLIFMGGIGFIVWNDLWENKLNFRKLNLHSKVVLVASAVLIFVSWWLFFLFERGASMKDMSTGEAVLASLFQAITPRTAGFYTINQAALSESGSLLTMVLMLLGGSSGSTAGGIKITTFAVLFLGVFSAMRNNGDVVIGKKRLQEGIYAKASMLLMTYLFGIILFTAVMCAYEPFTLKEILFETVSAVGTVGLSTGITASLTTASKIILTVLMYAGRVGALSLALAVGKKRNTAPLKRPVDKIAIG